jgi:16S rRNA (cytosine1402-N4)-methyltransferase
MMDTPHIPVLLDEVLNSFAQVKPGYFVDCTLGYGGHSIEILNHHSELQLIGIDRDDEALDFSRQRLQSFSDRSTFIKGDFASVLPTLDKFRITALLADFGVSSLQLDKTDRGFGFDSNALDMRMDRSKGPSAYDIVNNYSADQLSMIFREYGEIRASDKLADAIIAARISKPITSGSELSTIAKQNIKSHKKIHPATLMFQAIRIEVNDELGQIKGLLDALEALRPSGAVISLITFHSLEDRLVKQRFRQWSKSCICDPSAIRCTCGNNHSLGTILTRKPIVASNEEIRTNPRSRSAKLRIFRFKDQM